MMFVFQTSTIRHLNKTTHCIKSPLGSNPIDCRRYKCNESKNLLKMQKIGKIILGCSLLLGMSIDLAAFDIQLHRGVFSQRHSSTAPITKSYISINDVVENHYTTGLSDSHNQSHDDEKNCLDVIQPSVGQTFYSWFTIIILVIFGRMITIPSNSASSFVVRSTAVSLVPYAATVVKPTKFVHDLASIPNRQRQAAILGGSFALFQLLSFHAKAISSWYMDLLAWSPLVTKAVTTATIGVVGDTTAQYFETRLQRSIEKFPKKADDESHIRKETHRFSDSEKSTNRDPISWPQTYDRRRGLSVFVENILVSGPLLHFAYNTMENILPTSSGGREAILAALGHALLDNFVLDTIFLALFFISTGIAEGYIRELVPQFRKDFLPTLKTGWLTGLCLVPVQSFLFRFLPLSLRVLGTNIIDIFWEAYTSYMVHRRRRQAAIEQ